MALQIKQLLDYSWMSQASYLSFEGLNQGEAGEFKDKLETSTINEDKQFSPAQTEMFTGSNTAENSSDGFSFAHHKENTDSGFSATVFKKRGQIYLS